METKSEVQLATFGGGCFWCVEAAFEQVRGVLKVESGYAGGSAPDPSYREVCTGRTGHAEVVQVTFDPAAVSFEDLLDVFFVVHDPTTLNRQGADQGTQYRSVIYYHSDAQRETATRRIAELNAAEIWDSPIVTEVQPSPAFFRAEEYHQGYYRQNADQPYCQAVIAPKLSKLRHVLAEKLYK